ncbi:hypothetical protein B0T17DRAFT_520305, partial [Bombardia bombarda]
MPLLLNLFCPACPAPVPALFAVIILFGSCGRCVYVLNRYCPSLFCLSLPPPVAHQSPPPRTPADWEINAGNQHTSLADNGGF